MKDPALQERAAQAVELRRSGITLRDISEITGLTINQCHHYCFKAGVKLDAAQEAKMRALRAGRCRDRAIENSERRKAARSRRNGADRESAALEAAGITYQDEPAQVALTPRRFIGGPASMRRSVASC